MTARFAADSLRYIGALPGKSHLETSTRVGWRSLLATHSRTGTVGAFETHPTRDQMVCIITGGHGELRFLRGGWQRAPLTVGTVSLVSGHERLTLSWTATADDRHLEHLHFFIPQQLVEDAQDHFRRPNGPSGTNPLSALAIANGFVADVGRAALAAMRGGAPDIYAQVTAQWLAMHLLACPAGSTDVADGRRPGRITKPGIRRAVEFIEANLDREIDLDVIADQAGVSKFHFATLFRRETGETPIRFLFRKRVEKAASLLGSTDLPIKQVAFSSGFRNVAHFNQMFRRCFNLTPSEFRKAERSSR